MGKRHRGAWPGWKPSTARQAGILADIIEAYDEHRRNDTLPRGGRGIFYDLRPNGRGNGVTYRKPDSQHPVKSFGPMEAHPAAVQEVLVLARRAGIIREHWVADTRAPDSMGNSYDEGAADTADTIAQIVRNAAENFDLDPQRFEPIHVEILCEAEDLIPRLARIANPFGVEVFSGAGYGGLKGKRAFAERALERGKPTVVLNISDRDKDGDKIYIAAAEDSVAWADNLGSVLPLDWYEEPPALRELRRFLLGEALWRGSIWFVRFALTTTQATALGLLDADGKAEVDGVPVATMDGWITDGIRALQNRHGRRRHRTAVRQQRELLPDLLRAALA